MIIEDASLQSLPGKDAALRQACLDLARYYDQHWPKTRPMQVVVDLSGEGGRVHFRTVYESLADYERERPSLSEDPGFAALVDAVFAVVAPGSVQRTFLRVL